MREVSSKGEGEGALRGRVLSVVVVAKCGVQNKRAALGAQEGARGRVGCRHGTRDNDLYALGDKVTARA